MRFRLAFEQLVNTDVLRIRQFRRVKFAQYLPLLDFGNVLKRADFRLRPRDDRTAQCLEVLRQALDRALVVQRRAVFDQA